MAKQFVIRKAHWLGTRFAVETPDSRPLYEVFMSGFSYRFREPGMDEPIFETRSTGIFSSTIAVVESAVDYELAYFKNYSVSHTCAYVMNQAKEINGFLITANRWDAFLEWRKDNESKLGDQTPEEIMRHAYNVRIGFRQSMAWASAPTRAYRLVDSSQEPAATFEIPKDRKSLTLTVHDGSGRYFDERLMLVLGVRCLTGQNHNNGA